MDQQKGHDSGHAQEMHQPGGLEAAEQNREFRELHRLPQRQTRDHDEDPDQHDTDIKNFLNRVVVRQIIMAQTKSQRVADGRENLAHRYGEQLLSKTSGCDAIGQITKPIDDKDPHSREMPLQSILRPPTDHDAVRKVQPAEDHIIVVKFSSAADHDENGDRIDPMHNTRGQRVKAAMYNGCSGTANIIGELPGDDAKFLATVCEMRHQVLSNVQGDKPARIVRFPLVLRRRTLAASV